MYYALVTAALFILLVQCKSTSLNDTECSHSTIRHCQSHIKGFYFSENQIVPHLNATALKHNCRKAKDYYECIDRFIGDCNAVKKATVMGIRGSIQHMCEEGKSDYLSLRSCRKVVEANNERKNCTTIYITTLLRERHLGALCKGLNAYVSCVATRAAALCGKQGGRFYYKSAQRIVHNMGFEGHVQCRLKDPFDTEQEQSDNNTVLRANDGLPTKSNTTANSMPRNSSGTAGYSIISIVFGILASLT